MKSSRSISSEVTYQMLEVDDALLEVFQEEAIELHDKLLTGLEAFLERNDAKYLGDIARDLHTLKGCALLISYHGLAAVCHGLEEAMKTIVHQRDVNLIDNIHKALHFISMALSQIHTQKAPVPGLDIVSGLSEKIGKEFEASLQGQDEGGADTLDVENTFSWEQTGYRVSMEEMESYFSAVRKLIKSHSRFSWQLKDIGAGFDKVYALIEQINIDVKNSPGMDDAEVMHLLSNMSQVKNVLGAMNRSRQMTEGINEKQGFIINALDDKIINARLVDFRLYIPRLEQTVQKTAETLNKKIRLSCQNVETEVDKRLLEKLMPAFEHLIRNAIDHGIESAQKRKLSGKNLTGHIDISLKRENNHIVFLFTDDGQGIDIGKIENTAKKQGIIGQHEVLSAHKAIELLKTTGFSTKDNASTVSGRGVGVNAVVYLIQSLGGRLDIKFKKGQWTTFVITLPITQSQHAGLLFCFAGIHYFFSMSNIVGVTRLPFQLDLPKKIQYGHYEYPLMCLSQCFNLERDVKSNTHCSVIIIKNNQHTLALKVDEIIGVRDFVVQPVPDVMPHKSIFEGLSILDDGEIIYGINATALLSELYPAHNKMECEKTRRVLIVDDSAVVRKQVQKLFLDSSYEVCVANSGIEALELLEIVTVDIIITDIEMPGMDGFELSSKLKASPLFSDIPIIMMTSRRQVEDLARAKKMGVTKLVYKPISLAILQPYLDTLKNGQNHG